MDLKCYPKARDLMEALRFAATGIAVSIIAAILLKGLPWGVMLVMHLVWLIAGTMAAAMITNGWFADESYIGARVITCALILIVGTICHPPTTESPSCTSGCIALLAIIAYAIFWMVHLVGMWRKALH